MTATSPLAAASAATASPVPLTRTSVTSIAGRQTFWRAVRAEWIKLRTLRSTWVSSAVVLLLTAAIGAAVCLAAANPNIQGAGAAYRIVTGTTFGQIVVAVLGALVATGEYSSGQIRSTLAAVPRRSRTFWAKALVVGAWSFGLGVISIVLAWAISTPFMHGYGVPLTDHAMLGFVWGTGLAYAAIALMSLGLGFLLRSTAGSITVVTTLLFVVNLPLAIAGTFWHWALNVYETTPSVVVTSVIDPYQAQSTWADTDPSMFLSHLQAVLVFGAWVAVPLLLGWLLFVRRDA